MRIIIDTREQRPLPFKVGGAIEEVITRKLSYGDYSCDLKCGHTVPYFFERKSINDLFGTFSNGKNYKRVKREFARAYESGHKLIIAVEGTMTKVCKGCKYSLRDGHSLVKQLLTIMFRYGILTIFFSSRDEMKAYIEEFYFAYGKHYYEINK